MHKFFERIGCLWGRLDLFCREKLLTSISQNQACRLIQKIDIVVNGKRWIGKNLLVEHVTDETVTSECDDYWAYRCLCRTANGSFAEVYLEEFEAPLIFELSEAQYFQRLNPQLIPNFYPEA